MARTMLHAGEFYKVPGPGRRYRSITTGEEISYHQLIKLEHGGKSSRQLARERRGDYEAARREAERINQQARRRARAEARGRGAPTREVQLPPRVKVPVPAHVRRRHIREEIYVAIQRGNIPGYGPGTDRNPTYAQLYRDPRYPIYRQVLGMFRSKDYSRYGQIDLALRLLGRKPWDAPFAPGDTP